MLIRAGASNREMVGAPRQSTSNWLYNAGVRRLGQQLAGLAGLIQAPILTAQIGMGEKHPDRGGWW